jgi:hypothetical protein
MNNEAFETFWYWMNERHAIYKRRELGQEKPWTEDWILRSYRFCNVFRELDVVTIWIDEHIRKPYAKNDNLWIMLALARTLNHPDTLQEIMDEGMWPVEEYDGAGIADVLDARKARKDKVYTGAYMIRAESDKSKPWFDWTKQRYIAEIVIGQLWDNKKSIEPWLSSDLQHFHSILCEYHGWGSFMSYEVVTDMRWTRYLENAPDIHTWANAGPGAKRGLNRIFGRELTKGLSQDKANSEMQWLLKESAKHLHPQLHDLDNIEMRDIEHSLCEVDKYLRVKHGEGKPRSIYHGQ